MVTGKSKVDKELCTLVDYYNEQLRLLNKHKTPRISQDIRDRPFNLKGGVMVFCFVQNFFFGQHEMFFQNSTLGYMTKTLNQIIFVPPPKSEYFFRKKNHNPPFKLNGRSLIVSMKDKHIAKVQYQKNVNVYTDGIHPSRKLAKLWLYKFIEVVIEVDEYLLGCCH